VALALPFDWRLLGFLTVLSMLTAVAFGLAPAWRTRRIDAGDAIAQATHGRVTPRGAVSGPLVVGQVALSLVLVVAAALLGRTFSTLATRDLGFDPDDLHTVAIELGRTPQEARPELAARVREAAARVPGVRHAAVSVVEPMSGMGWNGPISVPGVPDPPGRDRMVMFNAISPGWFTTYGTRLIAGRDFDASDDRGAPVAIVDEAFAQHFFGTPAAVGRRVLMETGPGQSAELEIVGVSTAAAYRGVRGAFPPTLYRPVAQMAGELPPFLTLGLRTMPGGASGLHAAMTRAVREVDPALTLTYRTMAGRVRDQLTEIRATTLLSSFFGMLALVLAGIGLYGVTSYGVAERRREIGIRLTLGAGRARAQRLVLRRVALLVGLGVVLGGAASAGLTPLLRSMLHELEPRDPITIAGSAAVLAAVGLLAGWLPAWRAARIDPAQVLRES
jgi:predicted permease